MKWIYAVVSVWGKALEVGGDCVIKRGAYSTYLWLSYDYV